MACPNTTFGSLSRLSTRDNWNRPFSPMLDPCEVQRFGSSSAGSGPIRAGHGQSGPDPGTGDPAADEIVEARRRIGMLGAERRLAGRQRALVERPRPRTSAFPCGPGSAHRDRLDFLPTARSTSSLSAIIGKIAAAGCGLSCCGTY